MIALQIQTALAVSFYVGVRYAQYCTYKNAPTFLHPDDTPELLQAIALLGREPV